MNVAEQPARLALDDRAMLQHWKPSYARGLRMQASLAVIGAILGLLAGWLAGDWRWIAGSGLMLANVPFTMLVILPVNRQLEATPDAVTGGASRRLIERWGRLHGVRTALGFAATAAYLWALG